LGHIATETFNDGQAEGSAGSGKLQSTKWPVQMLRLDPSSQRLPRATRCPRCAYGGLSPHRGSCPLSLKLPPQPPDTSRHIAWWFLTACKDTDALGRGPGPHAPPRVQTQGPPGSSFSPFPLLHSWISLCCQASAEERREPCPKAPARSRGSRAVCSVVPALPNAHLQPPAPCPLQAFGTGQSKRRFLGAKTTQKNKVSPRAFFTRVRQTFGDDEASVIRYEMKFRARRDPYRDFSSLLSHLCSEKEIFQHLTEFTGFVMAQVASALSPTCSDLARSLQSTPV